MCFKFNCHFEVKCGIHFFNSQKPNDCGNGGGKVQTQKIIEFVALLHSLMDLIMKILPIFSGL